MNRNTKDNLAVVLVCIGLAAVAGAIWYIVANNLTEAAITAALVFVAAAIVAYVLTAVAVGTHAVIKKKDTVHSDSGSTLNDITSVEKEMNRSDDEKP